MAARGKGLLATWRGRVCTAGVLDSGQGVCYKATVAKVFACIRWVP